MKSGPGRLKHERKAGKRRQAGSRLARRMVKFSGRDWKGEIIHSGALTEANRARAQKRAGVRLWKVIKGEPAT